MLLLIVHLHSHLTGISRIDTGLESINEQRLSPAPNPSDISPAMLQAFSQLGQHISQQGSHSTYIMTTTV